MTRLIAIIAALVVLAGLGGTWLATRPGTDRDRFADCRTATIAGGAGQIGGPFTLVNKDGETVTDKDVITGPTLIYFGYTFCPDVCPLDNARNAEAVDLLEGMGKIVTPVFISIDPARDTPEVVGDFAEAFHDRMIGLTGSPEQVAAAAKAYRAYYKAHTGEGEYYSVDHSTFTYLVFPEIGFVDFFRHDASAEQVAKQVACFIDHA